MRIESAAINLQSQHSQQKISQQTESLRFWHNPPAPPPAVISDKLKLSQAAQQASTATQQVDLSQQLTPEQSLTLEIIRRMFKAITGEDLTLLTPPQLQGQVDQLSYQTPPPPTSGNTGTGMVYQRSSSYQETETTQFSASGTLQTQDGKYIEFNVALNMSRSFYTESQLSIRAGDAEKIDPLVVNFDGNAAELSSDSFQFDIDADGHTEQIASLKSNSGLLALDKNQDGKINDGSELFGPNSGNGFAELAAYDQDGNQFIDEGDAIYQQLRIWQRHPDGSQQLLALGDKNIGAIFLGHVSSPFQLKTDSNQSLGEIASSGVYLTEQGQVGTVQQINFAV